ncbi:MAG: hypothetical protein ACRCWG_13540 [Sarcina sp.]
MWKNYIVFNNINSLDKGLIVNSIDIGCPKPEVIIQTVPFMNGSYDFSNISNGGIQTFEDRTVIVKFSYKNINASNQYNVYLSATAWLMSGAKGSLEISSVPGILTGKCIECSKLSKSNIGGTFTATFLCDPFINQGEFGDYIWDTFNFESGVAEVNQCMFNTGDNLEIYCDVDSVRPILNSNIACSLNVNGDIYNLKVGDNSFYDLIFNYGINKIMVLSGNNGELNISFKKEVV